MSTRSAKIINCLCLSLFLLLSVILVLLAAVRRMEYLSDTSVTIDRRVALNGMIYDLRDDENDTVWLREISPGGELISQLRLSRLDWSSEEYLGYGILDISDGTIWIWETRYDIYDLTITRESILRCELDSKTIETVYSRDGLESESLFSPKIWDGFAYTGQRSDGFITIWQIALDGGQTRYYAKIKDDGISGIFIPSGGGIAGVTPGSVVTLYNGDGSAERILYSPGEYGVIASFSVGADGELFLYTVAGGEAVLLSVGLDGSGVSPVDLPDALLSVSPASKTVWAGHDMDFTLVHSDGMTIERLKIGLDLLPDAESVFKLLALIVPLALIILIIRHLALRRRIPLVAKQIAFAIPIFAAGMYIIIGAVISEIDSESLSSMRRELVLHAEHTLQTTDLTIVENIQWDSPFTDENYLRLREALEIGNSERSNRFLDSLAAKWHSDASYINCWLFAVDGSDVRSVFCGSLSVGLPYEYVQIKDLSGALKSALNYEGSVLTSAFDERGGKWYMLRYPVKNGSGEIVALLDVSLSYTQATYFLRRIEYGLALRITALMIAIMVCCAVVSSLALRRLRRLKHGTEALCEGDYGYRVTESGNDEVTDIARAFNIMAERVECSVSAISETNRSFSRFVPSELFSILGKSSVLEVAPGDSAELECTLMCLYTDEFEKHMGDGLFNSLCHYYQSVMPAVSEFGGVIDRCGEDVMSALFLKPAVAAVYAARRIFKTLDSSALFHGDVNCTAVIDCRQIRLGVIGNDDRLYAAIVTHFLRQSRQLGRLGKKLGCRILLTGEAIERGDIPGGSYRYIGKVVMDGIDCPLYEVLTGESCEERLRSRESFDEAVSLYYGSRFYEARNLFVELIKRSPGDLVAREYLLLSDRLMQAPKNPQPLLTL